MPPRKPPVLSGRALVKALESLGYQQVSQRGSHVKLKKRYHEGEHTLVVPLHKELDRGTLGSIINRVKKYIPEETILEALQRHK
ncbi:MAG: type II toxin-antitoxin system HicA family toxin [Dehalococcoidia bacterium]|nr:type II toxin-antitoxin system HicA family toxin [Dehalococcoidia bacterium]